MNLDSSEADPQSPSATEVRFEHTPQLPEILEHLNASILVTTYQAGKLLVIGVKEGKLNISFLDYDQPMGLAVSPSRIAIGTRRQMHFLVPAHETQANQDFYDGCFVPRSTHYTGSIHGHDLAWGEDGLWVVNTLFSSLATLHEDFSFVPRWSPPFITQLIDQDRCHLNGMAVEMGKPKFATAMSETDFAAGWRPNKASGGVIMEVPSGRVVCRNLSMPHSPRWYDNRLWVLDSGRGTLCQVDPTSGRCDVVEQLPGYTRGLSFCGQFAFVGLSKIRETSVFGGVPIAEKRDELRCGIGVVDLLSGNTVAVFQFHTGVSEIFAVDTLHGFKNPLIAGASVDQQEREVWIVPSPNAGRPVSIPRLPIFSGPNAQHVGSQGLAGAPKQSSSALAAQAMKLVAERSFDQAALLLEQAIAQSTTPAPLLVDLGNLRQEQGNQAAALLCYERAVAADPACVPALQNLGYLQFNMGEAEKAHDTYERLIGQSPTQLNRLLAASVLPVVYDSTEDISYWRQRQLEYLSAVVAVKDSSSNDTVDATQSLVPTCFFAAYQGLCGRQLMEMRGSVIRGRDFILDRVHKARSDSRLRVGILSAYLRDHTIGRLNIGRLEKMSRKKIHLTVVYAGGQADEMTQRYEKCADEFVRLSRALPEAIHALASLDLDVLVHTDVGMDSLTQTLAYSRFAPIQLATWGHPETTGSRMIDYFLSSVGLEPDNGQAAYTEKLLLLPSLGIDYERPEFLVEAGIREQLHLPHDQHLYVCPQTLFKFHPDFDAILAQILEEDPLGELVLLEGRLPEWTHRLRRRFRRTLPEQGRRVRFLPAIPRKDFLSLLATADVLLDPIHFGGGNSSIEALAVGRPVVTMRGDFLRSRITSALYEEVGLQELIAGSGEAYCVLACKIASNENYRGGLRKRVVDAAQAWFGSTSGASQLEECLLALKPYSK